MCRKTRSRQEGTVSDGGPTAGKAESAEAKLLGVGQPGLGGLSLQSQLRVGRGHD